MSNKKLNPNNQQTFRDSIFPPISSVAPMPKVTPPKKEQGTQSSKKSH